MFKGKKITCIETRVKYLTVGNVYDVLKCKGDLAKPFGVEEFQIQSDTGFCIKDDVGDEIFQHKLYGAHARFEFEES